MKLNYFAYVLCALFFTSFAFAADAAVPGFGAALSELIASISTKAPFAVVLVAVIQFLRTNEIVPILGALTGRYLQLATVCLTALGYVAAAYLRGASLGASLVEGLLTGGGATLIYDQIRAIKGK